jgi:hypothetical protein
MDDGYAFYRQLASNPPLMAAVAALNRGRHEPAPPWADAEGGQGDHGGRGWPDPLQGLIQRSVAARPGLRRLFPGGSKGPDFWDFGPEPWRLALLPPGEFEELTLRFGAAVWGGRWALAVEGGAVRRLRAGLGPELLDWAIRRGRFALGPLAEAWRLAPEPPCGREAVAALGLQAVNLAWSPLPDALRDLAGPRHLDGDAAPIIEGPPADLGARTFARLKSLLITEVAPSWRPCFS